MFGTHDHMFCRAGVLCYVPHPYIRGAKLNIIDMTPVDVAQVMFGTILAKVAKEGVRNG